MIKVEGIDPADFIERVYGNSIEIQKEMKGLSFKVASALEKGNETPIGEVVLILAMDDKQKLNLLEVNPNGPEIVYDVKLFTSSVISYAESLAVKEMEKIKL